MYQRGAGLLRISTKVRQPVLNPAQLTNLSPTPDNIAQRAPPQLAIKTKTQQVGGSWEGVRAGKTASTPTHRTRGVPAIFVWVASALLSDFARSRCLSVIKEHPK